MADRLESFYYSTRKEGDFVKDLLAKEQGEELCSHGREKWACLWPHKQPKKEQGEKKLCTKLEIGLKEAKRLNKQIEKRDKEFAKFYDGYKPTPPLKEQGECKHNWVTSYITPIGTGYECSKCGVEKGQEKSPPLKEDIKEIEKLTNDDFDGSSDHDAINFLWEWNIEMQNKLNELIDAINHLSSVEK